MFVPAAVVIAMRGSVPFVDKVRRLAAAGAIAVVIVNSSGEKFFRIKGHYTGDGPADLGHGIKCVIFLLSLP